MYLIWDDLSLSLLGIHVVQRKKKKVWGFGELSPGVHGVTCLPRSRSGGKHRFGQVLSSCASAEHDSPAP